MTDLIEAMSAIARAAGAAIADVYAGEDLGVVTKTDDSPVTRADLAAHDLIVSALLRDFPGVPILSEESDPVPFGVRGKWRRYFLVDPLDGTREFISRNGEFTVNIALIEAGVPVLGVVYVPVQGTLYTGDRAGRRATVMRDGVVRDIRTRPLDPARPLTVVASRRHGGEALRACMNVLRTRFAQIETTSMGSSLKLCLIAEGKADLYPRLAPTAEWDTAAAQAVVEAAGGRVVDTRLNLLRYNRKEGLLNPFFYALADAEFDWQSLLRQVGRNLE